MFSNVAYRTIAIVYTDLALNPKSVILSYSEEDGTKAGQYMHGNNNVDKNVTKIVHLLFICIRMGK